MPLGGELSLACLIPALKSMYFFHDIGGDLRTANRGSQRFQLSLLNSFGQELLGWMESGTGKTREEDLRLGD